jgi:AcrR family transcriptional regulator
MPKRRTSPPLIESGGLQATQDEEVRRAILAATRGLVERYGFRKTTMDDIARMVGKQRSSLYYYFSTKEAVIKALVENELAEMSRVAREQVEKQTGASDRLRTFMIARLEHAVQRSAVFGQTLPELRSGDDETPDIFWLSEQVRAFDRAEERYLVDIVIQGIRDGEFRSLSKNDVNLFSHLVFSALRGIALELLLDPEQRDGLRARLEVAFDIVFRGLLR